MDHRTLGRKVLLPLALLLAAAAPLAAQTRAPAAAEATLAARMHAFLREVEDTPNTELAGFFPRRGDWTWVQTLRDRRGHGQRVGVWRFPGGETPRAIGAGGPVCDSFHTGGGEFGPVRGRFGAHVMDDGPWHLVRGNRYVPPDASAASPVFVEWRREGGEWVVSAFGDEDVYVYSPRMLGVEAGAVSRDTTSVPEGAAYAAGESWYLDRRPMRMEHRRYIQYGPPRAFSAEERAHLKRVGVLGGVSVYAEKEMDEPFPDYLYLPVSPGEFHPYQSFGPEPCR